MATISNTASNDPAGVASLQGISDKPQSNLARSVTRLRRHRMAMFGAAIILGVFLYVGIGSLIFSEAQANFNDPSNSLQYPSREHPMGTDDIGRDIMIRTIYGGQISLFIGFTAMSLEILLGAMIGISAGFFGGLVDSISMRGVEAMLCIPQLFIALIASRVFAGKLPDITISGREYNSTVFVIVLVIGLTSWMGISRIVRSTVLSIKEQEYILAARSIGVTNRRIMFGHVLPNCIAPLIVASSLGVASAILLESYLGFLGFGVRPPMATWGNMLNEAFDHMNYWFIWFFPAFFVIAIVLGINFLGDGLRDAFDPRSLKN